VISLICENISSSKSEEIIKESQKHIVANVLKKVDVIYKQIKKFKKFKELKLKMTIFFGYPVR
jgi:hypothetical protein